MDFSPSLPSLPRLRVTRHSQLSPLDDDLSRTPTAGPSRLHALQHDESEDTDATPRLTVSSSLPSVYAVTEDTPAARLRALLAQVPNTSSVSRTQLLHEPSPSLPSDRESDFEPPPRWANSSINSSSARESLRSLFTHALREPGDTPRKDVRRNSIDLSEVEDTPRSGRVLEERARNKGKRMSFSDEELDKSSPRKTPTSTSHAANMQALRNRILSSHASQLSESTSAVSDASTDNTTSLLNMHAPRPGIASTSMQTVQLSAQFQSHSNLLDQDSEMQRVMGAADSFDGASTNQGQPPSLPPAPQMAVSSIAARPRSSLVRAGSLTETKLSANALRRSGGPRRNDSYDSISSVDSVAGNASSTGSTPERRDSYHHHRASHSSTGSPLPEEFPRQRHESIYSGSSRSPSRAGSTSSIADFRDHIKDIEKERQRERERAWNMPLSARSRTLSHTGSAGHSSSPRRGSDQPRSTSNSAPRSREDSRAPSPSESVRSRATDEGGENRERERNWGSPQPRWDHQYRPSASPIPGSSALRPRTQSTHSNGSDRRLRHTPSQSSLHSEGSSRPSSPADLTHQRQTGLKDEDEEAIHEHERNWGSRQQKWNHTHIHKRAVSPNLTTTHSRVRTNTESDPTAPATSASTRLPNGLIKGHPSELSLPAPAEQHLSSRNTAPPPEAPEHAERDETSRYPMSASPVNGHAHDKPLRVPSRHLRPDSPLHPSTANGNSANVKGASPGSASRFGWQFPRNRPQLPEFEPDTSSPERSPSPVHRPTGRIVGSGIPSHIPVRSPGQVPKVAIRRNGDVQTFTKGHKRATTEFTEANGAVPPKIHFPEPESASESESTNAKSLQGSDESIQDAPTPIARPIEIPPPEKLQPFSPVHAATAAEDPDSDASSPQAATPIDTAPSFELSTPLRPSLSTSKIEFETPPPPKGLPELPGPPSSSEDETESIDIVSSNRQGDGPSSLSVAKTPRVPGAWAATPAPARSQTPQPTSSSFALAKPSRSRSNSLPQTSFTESQSSTVAPPSALSRAGALPARTPAPPGGWFSTPGSLRRKSLMKVRFDNITSDSAISDADTGRTKAGKVEVSLPIADWDAASSSRPGVNISESISEPSFNHVESSSPAPGPSALASRDGPDGPTANSPPETNNYTTAALSPRRRSRRSPSVRLVDEYGRAQEDQPITPSRKDVRDHSASLRMPGGGPLKTPRSASVRMVDALGHEVEEPSEQNDSEDTVTEVRYSRQEALQRMKRAVADLQDGLRGVDTSSSVGLDDPRLSELYDLSKAAREMRGQLASSLQQAQIAHKYGSLKDSMRKSRFLPNFLPEQRVVFRNHWLFWTLCFLQFILFLVMYRMSRIHARRHFLTTYFDPFYGDLYIHPNKPEYNYDTNMFAFLRRRSSEPSYTDRLGIDGPIDRIQRGIADAVAQMQHFIWESWGTGNDRVKAWPPT